jgi:eukaryotic-like serine/threonine-protein kinase
MFSPVHTGIDMQTDDRYAEIDRLFAAALDLPAPERAGFLEALRAREPELAGKVAKLLAAAARPDPRLDPDRWVGAQARRGLAWAPADAAARVGDRVGPYRILEEIGRGGMSVVYLAERADGLFQQKVALKFLSVPHELGVRRFEQERQILADLSHPNIARLLDGGADERGVPYIVMEHVRGRPLDVYCRDTAATLDRRLELVAAVAGVLEYAHRHLVVHRDIKPSNILVTEDGEVKLLDFGIAKLLEPASPDSPAVPATGTMMRVLTPEYASPEQVRGERITTASDIYQLGVLLFELLAGRRPYDLIGATTSRIERVICDEEPPAPSRATAEEDGLLRRRLRGDMDAIVLMALAKEPERRYASVGELREDLQRFRVGQPVRARQPRRLYRAGKFVRRHRGGVAAAAVALLSLLAGLGASSWQAVVASRERDRAERARIHAETVSDFLVEVFEVSDPERARGQELAARELLDRGAQRVGRDLEDPALTATLMGVMGRAYRNLGLYDAAEPLLESAVALSRDNSEGTALDAAALAAGLDQLGRLRVDQRRLEEAGALFQEALAIRRRLNGPAHPDIAQTLGNLSELRLLQRDMDAAEQLAVQALVMTRRLHGGEHPAVAAAQTALGRVHLFRGDYSTAAEHLTEAVELQRRLLPGPHRDLASSLNHLGQVRHNQGRLDEARDLYGEAHRILQHVLGPDHPQTADTYNNLGVLLYSQGNLEDAAAIFEEVLASRRRVLDDDHPLLGHTLHNLAAIHRSLKRFEEAEAGFTQSLEIRRRIYGDRHPDVALTLWNLAHLRRDQDRLGEAEGLLHQVLDIYRETVPTRGMLGRVLVDLGRVLLDQGRAADAEPHLVEGVAILEETYAPGHATLDDATRLLARARGDAALAGSPP